MFTIYIRLPTGAWFLPSTVWWFYHNWMMVEWWLLHDGFRMVQSWFDDGKWFLCKMAQWWLDDIQYGLTLLNDGLMFNGGLITLERWFKDFFQDGSMMIQRVFHDVLHEDSFYIWKFHWDESGWWSLINCIYIFKYTYIRI